jgi:hypothetical protein
MQLEGTMHRSFLIFFAALAVSAQPNLPGMAAGILDQAKLAQQAVGLRDRDAAMDHIKQGLSLANEIQQNSPDSPRPILIPVYREIETTTTYTPVKHKDGEMNADRLKSNTSVRGVAGDVTTTKLDVMAAADRLRVAQASVESDDWKGADSALAAVGASVVVTQAQGNMPLNMARQNLELARMRALDGKYRARWQIQRCRRALAVSSSGVRRFRETVQRPAGVRCGIRAAGNPRLCGRRFPQP